MKGTVICIAILWATSVWAQTVTPDDEMSTLVPLDGTSLRQHIHEFQSSIDGEVRPYLIALPAGEKLTPNLPLLIALTPNATNQTEALTTYFEYGLAPHAEAAGFAVVTLNPRAGVGGERLTAYDALDLLETLTAQFPIDRDRIYLFGAGSGGDAAYRVGLQYPDRFAAMAIAEGVGPTDLTQNALHLPQYMVNGTETDTNKNILYAFRKMVHLFSGHGCTIEHKEYRDRWWVFLPEEWETIFNWLQPYRRVINPKKVVYSALQLFNQSALHPPVGAYWVRIDTAKDAHAVPQIRAEIKGNLIDVTAINVKQYTLLLNNELLSLHTSFDVRTNGELSFSGNLNTDAFQNETATLTVDTTPQGLTWIFAAGVGLVVLAVIGTVGVRLLIIRPKAQTEVSAQLPTVTAGFRGIWLIAMKEFHIQLLTERFLWTSLFCLGTVWISLWVTTQDYHTQLTNHDLSRKKPENLYSGRLFHYDLQPNHYTSKGAYYRQTSIVKAPNVMSLFVQGIEKRMGRPVYFSLHQEIEFDDTPYTNHLLNMYPAPDFMYVVQTAMSLLALLAVFQSICGERERGTLRLMLANAVPRDTILLGKFLGGYIGLMLPFLLATGTGLLALELMPSISLEAEEWIRIAGLMTISVLYISIFFTLGLLISAITQSPRTALLAALFTWVILVLVWPNIGTLLAGELKPIKSVQQQKVEKDLMKRRLEDEREEVKNSWDWIATYGQIHYEIWHDVRDAVWSKDADYRRRTQQLANYTRMLTRLSPAAAYAYASMDIAGTNISNELAYKDRLRRYIRNHPREAQLFVWSILYSHQIWDFYDTPSRWQDGFRQALIDVLLLVFLNALLFLMVYLAFLRYQV